MVMIDKQYTARDVKTFTSKRDTPFTKISFTVSVPDNNAKEANGSNSYRYEYWSILVNKYIDIKVNDKFLIRKIYGVEYRERTYQGKDYKDITVYVSPEDLEVRGSAATSIVTDELPF